METIQSRPVHVNGQQPDLADDATKVGKSMQAELKRYHGWLVLALGFLQPYLLQWLGPLVGADADILKKPWAEFYWTVFSHTAPMTVALALTGIFVVYCLREMGPNDGWGFFMITAGVGTLLLLVAAKVSVWFGLEPIPMNDYVDLFSPVGPLINTLLSYLAAYRAVLFISSMVLAAYGAYAWFAHLRPLLMRWRQQVNEAA